MPRMRSAISVTFSTAVASQLALTFTPEQRRILAYLLWRPRLADRKRRRMQMATHFLHLEDLRRAEQEFASDAIADAAN